MSQKTNFSIPFDVWMFLLFAQENITYQKPSAEILALADLERAPSVSMDSNKKFMLLSYRNTYKTLEDLSQGNAIGRICASTRLLIFRAR